MVNNDNLKNRGNNLSLELQVRNIIRRQSLAFNGVWYDPSDLSTLFQDAAGTIPVTGAGQPVGCLLDKSGRGNHATQSTAGFKPLYQVENGRGYLAFDGLDDFLVTGNVDFSTTDKIALSMGAVRNANTSGAFAVEFGDGNAANVGYFYVTAPNGSGANNSFFASKGSANLVTAGASPINNGAKYVFSGVGYISAPLAAAYLNGVFKSSSASAQGASNYSNYPLYIGRRGGVSGAFNGRLYGLAICGGLDDIYKLKKIEQYLAKKTGVII